MQPMWQFQSFGPTDLTTFRVITEEVIERAAEGILGLQLNVA
jgi:hypothetical protein